ncbi:hypothetical protein BD626DRAFT_553760 [Schizophyllum amplum]|uniref:C2H2-type domain-containing protein n=1 Tax=Schizophyllum amplum TaxID=97359 RepID=A0A550CWR5_9AGAR|nr:hypothetical protein BD626DRAFT_553760 [Auriculariopsis ampla]
MSASTQTETVLGKRKGYVLHLASSPEPSTAQSESEYEPEQRKASTSQVAGPIIVNGKLVQNTKKRYACTYEGCDKAYAKPSRLEEHTRSHTGQRPFVCPTCSKSYLRETHLQAHTRSHLPESARPFQCTVSGCSKRLWTSQHLRVHVDWHNGARPFQCTEEGCDDAFTKHHQLRAHICTAHCPEGTKPYRCENDGCTKSFSTNQKLHVHTRTHDEKRYTCLTCAGGDNTSASFSTWTALQHHNRTAHPPTCSHPACSAKRFTSQKGLRAHQKLHEQQEVEHAMGQSDAEDDDGPPRKKRRGGEVGRDWKCDVAGCGKDFKSKKALTTHTNVTHLGHRDFICVHEECGRAFGYKHLLQRHVAKVHLRSSSSSEEDEGPYDAPGDDAFEDGGPGSGDDAQQEGANLIDLITGSTYAKKAQDKLRTATSLCCPYPHLSGLPFVVASASTAPSSRVCDYFFSRAYDLRRHLRATHAVETDKDALDVWVKKEKRNKAGRLVAGMT